MATFAPIAIKDSSANVQSVLETLGDLAASQKITVVSLTDKTASLTIDRSVVSGRLDDASTSNGTISLLQKIGSKYTLKATNATVDDALSIKGPNKQAVLSLEVTDTADAVAGKFEALGALIKKKTVTAVYLSDQNPTLVMTAAQLKKNSANLAAIKSEYSIALTGVSLKDLTAANSNPKVSEISIKDSAANILKNAAGIKSASKVTSVEFNDKKELKFSIDQMMTLKGLGNVQEPAVGYVIADKALTVIAHIRYDINDIISGAKTVSITDKNPANITLDDARTLKTITNLSKGVKYNLVESITSVAANTSVEDEAARDDAEEVILATSYSIAEVNSLLKLKKLKRSVDVAVADTAANIIAEAKKTKGALSRGLTVTVRDTAANIATNIDALQALAKDNRITVIELTDNATPELDLTEQQWLKNADVIGKIATKYINPDNLSEIFSLEITPSDSVDEGSSFTITVNAEGISAGYEIPYSITGISAEDVDVPLVGILTVGDNGKAEKTVNIIADSRTEYLERAQISLFDGEITSSVVINDTSSQPATYALEYLSGTTVDEGSSFLIAVNTTGVESGSQIPYRISGVSSSDIDADLEGFLTVGSDGRATKTISVVADGTIEGSERLIIRLLDGEPSTYIDINDTSLFTLKPRDPDAGKISEPFRVIPGQGYIINQKMFLISQEKFQQSDNIGVLLKEKYGSDARLASWEELKQDLSNMTVTQSFLFDIGLSVTKPGFADPNLFVSRNGGEFDGGRGRWFISNFSGSNPSVSNYAAFDSINNSVYLGSYWYPGQALVVIDPQ